ncbi:hypothetical protein GPECTOR_174g211 [Gonium pectorale]|uniref:HECT-type E3 ubiquitin transferase n=1 Tax=Gonium pectorale TaxID=33097 RepID=A0A150FYH5_GONPE|nr:hypothetical protein GPECTOR_174g211 [Gonium pectorale]|eukprot:KXZ42255.1 hypothetical protein GPECTOR_174g211 [Gonium pectorale]
MAVAWDALPIRGLAQRLVSSCGINADPEAVELHMDRYLLPSSQPLGACLARYRTEPQDPNDVVRLKCLIQRPNGGKPRSKVDARGAPMHTVRQVAARATAAMGLPLGPARLQAMAEAAADACLLPFTFTNWTDAWEAGLMQVLVCLAVALMQPKPALAAAVLQAASDLLDLPTGFAPRGALCASLCTLQLHTCLLAVTYEAPSPFEATATNSSGAAAAAASSLTATPRRGRVGSAAGGGGGAVARGGRQREAAAAVQRALLDKAAVAVGQVLEQLSSFDSDLSRTLDSFVPPPAQPPAPQLRPAVAAGGAAATDGVAPARGGAGGVVARDLRLQAAEVLEPYAAMQLLDGFGRLVNLGGKGVAQPPPVLLPPGALPSGWGSHRSLFHAVLQLATAAGAGARADGSAADGRADAPGQAPTHGSVGVAAATAAATAAAPTLELPLVARTLDALLQLHEQTHGACGGEGAAGRSGRSGGADGDGDVDGEEESGDGGRTCAASRALSQLPPCLDWLGDVVSVLEAVCDVYAVAGGGAEADPVAEGTAAEASIGSSTGAGGGVSGGGGGHTWSPVPSPAAATAAAAAALPIAAAASATVAAAAAAAAATAASAVPPPPMPVTPPREGVAPSELVQQQQRQQQQQHSALLQTMGASAAAAMVALAARPSAAQPAGSGGAASSADGPSGSSPLAPTTPSYGAGAPHSHSHAPLTPPASPPPVPKLAAPPLPAASAAAAAPPLPPPPPPTSTRNLLLDALLRAFRCRCLVSELLAGGPRSGLLCERPVWRHPRLAACAPAAAYQKQLLERLLPPLSYVYEDDDYEAPVLQVCRSDLLGTSVAELMQYDAYSLSLEGICIKFEGEQAYGDGVLREWLTEVASCLFDPNAGLFRLCEGDARCLHPCAAGVAQDNHLELVMMAGRVLGLALRARVPLGVHLSSALYKMLQHPQPPGAEPAAAAAAAGGGAGLDPRLAATCGQIAAAEDVEALGLTFVASCGQLGLAHEVPLLPGGQGADTPVTPASLRDYLDRLARFYCTWGCSSAHGAELMGRADGEGGAEGGGAFRWDECEMDVVDALAQGLADALGIEESESGASAVEVLGERLRPLSAAAFNGRLGGEMGRVDAAAWRAATSAPAFKSDREKAALEAFWSVVDELSAEDQRRLLQFWTGTAHLPAGGFKHLSQQLQIVPARRGDSGWGGGSGDDDGDGEDEWASEDDESETEEAPSGSGSAGEEAAGQRREGGARGASDDGGFAVGTPDGVDRTRAGVRPPVPGAGTASGANPAATAIAAGGESAAAGAAPAISTVAGGGSGAGGMAAPNGSSGAGGGSDADARTPPRRRRACGPAFLAAHTCFFQLRLPLLRRRSAMRAAVSESLAHMGSFWDE